MDLHGRTHERAAINALVEDALAGAGGALVLLGEPGAGKSALLTDAARTRHELTVLRTAGIESEAPLAFAALQRLLRPLLRLLDRLPAPQANALRVVFGQEIGDAVDRFLVFLGALSLLAEAAEERPVLLIVDDAQWLDDASAAALLFIGRRVQQIEPVAMLFAAREHDARTFDSGDLPRLRLRALDLEATSAILAEHLRGVVSTEVSAQLLASTGGNPLALVELPQVLTPEQLEGRAPLPARLPVTEGVERVFLGRARRLSIAAQKLLLVAAADDSTRVSTIVQAAARLDVDAAALTELERSGLVAVSEEHLAFRHPLVRSAIYAAAPTAERRQVHSALAAVLTRGEDSDRRAWHRAASVLEPDESVVADLAEAATRAQHRGGHEAASAAWERAAELSTDPAKRAEKLLRAAHSAWTAANPVRAKELANAARREGEDPLLLADVHRLRARIEWNTGSIPLAHRILLEAASDVAEHDPARAREIAAEAMAIAAFGKSSGSGVDPAEFTFPPAADSPARERCYAELLRGLGHVVNGEWAEATPPLRLAFVSHKELSDDYELLPNLSIAALHVGDFDLARSFLERLLTEARNNGVVVMALYALTRLPFCDLATGQWAEALSHATEAVDLGADTGQRVLADAPRAWLLLLAALRGTDNYTELDDALQQVTTREAAGVLDVLLRDIVHWAHGVNETKPTAAFHHLAQMAHGITKRLASLDRIETAVRADQREAATLWVDDLESFADATDQAWAAAIAAHGKALLSRDENVERQFLRALELHGDIDRPFERARTQLAYGEFLRRSRRRVQAREHLRAAMATFEDLQARPWAERAAQEVRASGETVRKRDHSTAVELTPQERQVAQLVRQGLSNREVAAQLFVSPRTVDFHLRNVFTKTGVTSRVELAGLSLD